MSISKTLVPPVAKIIGQGADEGIFNLVELALNDSMKEYTKKAMLTISKEEFE